MSYPGHFLVFVLRNVEDINKIVSELAGLFQRRQTAGCMTPFHQYPKMRDLHSNLSDDPLRCQSTNGGTIDVVYGRQGEMTKRQFRLLWAEVSVGDTRGQHDVMRDSPVVPFFSVFLPTMINMKTIIMNYN